MAPALREVHECYIDSMKIAVIIPAAGTSERFGPDRDKLTEDMGGRPVLQRTVEVFSKRLDVNAIIVAGPADDGAFAEFKLRFGDKLGLMGVSLCQGGAVRTESVRNAIALVPDDCTHIAVHDAARPCASVELIDRVFDAVQRHSAVIPAIEVVDTLKRSSGAQKAETEVDPLDAILGDAGKTNKSLLIVEETVARDGLYAAQTPQAFTADLLRKAYEQDDLSGTDDAGLVERLGEEIVIVEGDARNMKITSPGDMRVAMSLMNIKPERGRETHKRF